MALIDVGLLSILVFVFGTLALVLILIYSAISSEEDEEETST